MARVLKVLTGQVQEFTRPGSKSAIRKTAQRGPQKAQKNGFHTDAQGDLRVHGGADKAIHLYPFEHYERWKKILGEDHPRLAISGAFGENLSTLGLLEESVCLSDQYQVGSALLEVSQVRQPCWKLNDHFQFLEMARKVQETGMTGWYFRVLREGFVQENDEIKLISRPYPDWTLQKFIEIFYGSLQLDREVLEEALQLPLVEANKRLIQRRINENKVEDWSTRIKGVL